MIDGYEGSVDAAGASVPPPPRETKAGAPDAMDVVADIADAARTSMVDDVLGPPLSPPLTRR
eukprot:2915869-Prorocentrum_lima.AAC.1